jgi:hypothetical protein
MLPEPILFHPLKHHLLYIKAFIQEQHTEAETKATLLTIGSSQLDLYTGKLPLRQIASEVILYLQENELLQPDLYQNYLTATGSD